MTSFSVGLVRQLTAHRLAQTAILIELLAAARSLAEILRLHVAQGAHFTADMAAAWVGGGLAALAFAAVSTLLYFAGRYRSAALVALLMIPALVAYKAMAIGLS